MLDANHFSLLPCTKEDISAIAAQGHFCFPPFDPTKDDDPVSLDTFFCKVVPNEDDDHFSKTYKLVENGFPNEILALASIANSGFSFGSYENKPASLQNSGYNESFPSVMLLAFGVRKDCQGQGLGSLAFKKLLQMIRESSIAGVRLLILHPLETAVPFYKSLGCVEVFDEKCQDEVESMFIDVWHKDLVS
jgi:GNAT superfamily N-acetyltransferase